FWQRALLKPLQTGKPALGDGDDLWDALLAQLRTASLRLTASTQRGSLVINLGVIFAVLALVPLAALVLGHSNDIRMLLWDSPWQGLVV
ncbi:hypothetical protein QP146_24685, partial [Escherichia coli]|nr:hypothetical protein [Escherichia coli]